MNGVRTRAWFCGCAQCILLLLLLLSCQRFGHTQNILDFVYYTHFDNLLDNFALQRSIFYHNIAGCNLLRLFANNFIYILLVVLCMASCFLSFLKTTWWYDSFLSVFTSYLNIALKLVCGRTKGKKKKRSSTHTILLSAELRHAHAYRGTSLFEKLHCN